MLSAQCETMFAGAPASFFNKEVTGTSTTYKALRGADLLDDGYLVTEGLQDLEVKEGRNVDKFLLQAGDVVLLARGQSMRCCIVTAEAARQRLIATANFIVIRLKPKHKAEFLVAFFNSLLGKQALNDPSISSSTNSMIKSLSLGNLKKMEMAFPSVEKQHDIAKLFHANIASQRSGLTFLAEQNKMVEIKILNLMEVA